MDSKIYLHGIGYGDSRYYYPLEQTKILRHILSDGKLLSRRLQGFKDSSGFNGMDYISLCDYEKKDVYNSSKKSIVSASRKNYNAYNSYIKDSISISFPKDELEVIMPTLVGNCTLSLSGYYLMKELGNEKERYSDLPDEVQVRDSISLDKSNGIIFPVDTFLSFNNRRKDKIDLLRKEIEDLRNMISSYNYEFGIYDMNSLEELSDESILRLTK